MGKHGQKHKILIVDDDEGNVNFLRLTFSGDYNVLCAQDGKAALEILNKEENRDIALILTDQKMPDMSGTELLKESRETHPNTMRMIITAFPDINDSTYAINEIHIDKYILKPVAAKINQLTEDVKAAVIQYELRRENEQLINGFKKLLERNIRIRKLFSKYLPRDLIRKFEKKEVPANDVEEKEVTILTAGIHQFNTLTRDLSPREKVILLNNYFSGMTEIIINHNGSIDKYFEEKIIAVFGFKGNQVHDPEKDAQNAVRCAVEMTAAFRESNKTFNSAKIPNMYLGIGIDTGRVVLGNIGSDYLLDYTVIGEVVNTASEIQKLTFNEHDKIFIGEETYQYLKNLIGLHVDIHVQKLALTKNKNRVNVYEV
jgi:adenylate cyclase